MLPCNVIIYEKDHKTILSVIKPIMAMQMIENESLKNIAEWIETQLKKVFDSVK